MRPIYGMEINDRYARFLLGHNILSGIAIISFLFSSMVDENEKVAKKILLGFTNAICVLNGDF